MREILFRGRRDNKGAWHEGQYITRSGVHFIQQDDDGIIKKWWVYPETIGQYTGANDRNGVKIFEGDILRWEFTDPVEEGGVDVCYAWVEYRNDNTHGSGFFLIDPEFGGVDTLDLINCREFSVVGNIHDNPELLEVRE